MGEAQQPRKTPKADHAAELEQQHNRLAAKMGAEATTRTMATGRGHVQGEMGVSFTVEIFPEKRPKRPNLREYLDSERPVVTLAA